MTSKITFKSNFNPNDLEKMMLANAKEIAKQATDIPLNCPGCEHQFNGHVGLNTCPNCQADINFTLS